MALTTFRIAFPAGFRALAERLVRRDYGPAAVLDGDDSTLTFQSAEPCRLPAYAQSTALVVSAATCDDLGSAYRAFAKALREGETRRILERVFRDRAYMRGGKAERFVVRGFVKSEPTFPGQAARNELEGAIAKITGARPDSARADVELSVTYRADGKAYFTAAGRASKMERSPEAGELPPQTARLLCELSEPSAEDVFLDPFMGSGSIPLERARMCPYKLIFASDADEASLAAVKERLKHKDFEKRRKTIFPKLQDARDLSRYEDCFFTSIVTDPPWGDWERLDEAQVVDLYASFLKEAFRTLAPEGRLVLLVGRGEALEKAIAQGGISWNIEEEYQVLISGKKARAVRLVKV